MLRCCFIFLTFVYVLFTCFKHVCTCLYMLEHLLCAYSDELEMSELEISRIINELSVYIYIYIYTIIYKYYLYIYINYDDYYYLYCYYYHYYYYLLYYHFVFIRVYYDLCVKFIYIFCINII